MRVLVAFVIGVVLAAGLPWLVASVAPPEVPEVPEVTGTVVGSSGRPLPGVGVILTKPSDPVPNVAATRTNQAGRFRIPWPPRLSGRGPFGVVARKEGCAPHERFPVSFGDDVRLILLPGVRVEVGVIDGKTREPVPGAWVWGRVELPDWMPGEVWRDGAETDSEGIARLTLPAGQAVLTATHRGYRRDAAVRETLPLSKRIRRTLVLRR